MAACCIQDFMLLFLLGFTPYSDTLNCYKGTMMKFGNDFSKTPIEWTSVETVSNLNEVLCQETLLIVDVGAKSLIVGSKGFARPGSKKTKHRKVHSGGPGIVAASYVNFCETDLCNAANTSQVLIGGFHISESTDLRNTQCSVCLHFKGSCTQNSNFVFCPEHTDCYASVIEIKRGNPNWLTKCANGDGSDEDEVRQLPSVAAARRRVVQNLHCEVSRNLRLEDDPGQTFNWTSDIESCNPGELCQETILLIKAEGTKTVVLASKSCIVEKLEYITFVQYTSSPGLIAISYSNYCNETLCNNKDNLSSFWKPPKTKGGMDSIIHVKGCTSVIGCKLMAAITSVGPMTVKETCNYHSFLQPRKAESGASWMLTSLWVLELLSPALLLPLTHFP
ncbi:testis-expressed sequence 101 protein [Sigmodon hispidus]